MFEQTAEYYKVVSYKAKRLAQEVSEVSKDVLVRMGKVQQRVLVEYEVAANLPFDEFTLRRKLIKQYRELYINIFKEEILSAEFKSIEYTRKHRFFTQLAELVEDNIDRLLVAIVDGGVSFARLEMEFIAGDFSDLMEGVEITREVVHAYNQYTKWGKMPNKARRDKIWKEVIWPDDNYYDRTLNIRFTAWGGRAPYWVLLDEGNEEYEGAYPKFTATNFFHQAVAKILADIGQKVLMQKSQYPTSENTETRIREEMREVYIKVADLVNQAVAQFLMNPDSYKAYDIFTIYEDVMNGFEYKIYVTASGKKVGVAKLR